MLHVYRRLDACHRRHTPRKQGPIHQPQLHGEFEQKNCFLSTFFRFSAELFRENRALRWRETHRHLCLSGCSTRFRVDLRLFVSRRRRENSLPLRYKSMSNLFKLILLRNVFVHNRSQGERGRDSLPSLSHPMFNNLCQCHNSLLTPHIHIHIYIFFFLLRFALVYVDLHDVYRYTYIFLFWSMYYRIRQTNKRKFFIMERSRDVSSISELSPGLIITANQLRQNLKVKGLVPVIWLIDSTSRRCSSCLPATSFRSAMAERRTLFERLLPCKDEEKGRDFFVQGCHPGRSSNDLIRTSGSSRSVA